jgi:hypothetical protein
MMKRLLTFSFAVIAIALGPSLMAQDFKKLEGQYAISSKTLLDPPTDEKKDRVLLSIHGLGAKELFDTMASPAKKDKCSGDLQTKSAGGLECSKSAGGTYQCTVGVLLTTGTTVKGRVC